MTTVPYSVEELRACVLAREFVDGERVMLGANVGAGRAALILAHLLHGPNMRVMLAMSWVNLSGLTTLDLKPGVNDFRNARGAEGYVHLDAWLYDVKNFFTNAFIIGGIQIDRFGNSNLIGLGPDHRQLTLRGPGGVGTPTGTAYADRYYLLPHRHTPEVLVERCDYVSSPGWGRGGADARERLGLPGGGPKLCVTELCVFDFDEVTKSMRVKSLHPGCSLEDVIERTGFEVIVPEHVPQTEAPRADELRVLRTLVDPEGVLRR